MRLRPQMVCARGFFDRVPGYSVFVLSNCYVEQTSPPGQSDKCRDRLASTSLSNLLSHTPTPWSTSFPSPILEVDSVERWARFFEVSGVTDYWPSLSLRNWYSGVAGKVLFSGRLYLVFFNETKLS